MRSLFAFSLLLFSTFVGFANLTLTDVLSKQVISAELYERPWASSVEGFGLDFGSGSWGESGSSSGSNTDSSSSSGSSSGSSSSSSSSGSSSSSSSGSSSSGSSSSSSSGSWSSSNNSVIVGKREWHYHWGVVVTTSDHQKWLVYTTNDYGFDPIETALLDSRRMSSSWKRNKCGIVKNHTVNDFMRAGRIGCEYSVFSCNDKMATEAMWRLVSETSC